MRSDGMSAYRWKLTPKKPSRTALYGYAPWPARRPQGLGSGTRNVRQASRLRSPPSLGPMDLPGPSACVGSGPLSHKAKGVRHGARVTNEHRSVRAQSGRFGGPGLGWRPSLAPAPRLMATPSSVTKAGPRVAPGGSRRAGNGAQRCFLHGVTRCFPRNSTVITGFRRQFGGVQL